MTTDAPKPISDAELKAHFKAEETREYPHMFSYGRLLATIAHIQRERDMARAANYTVYLRAERAEADAAILRAALKPFVESANHTRIFLTTREKMNPTGVDLYDVDCARACAAMGERNE